MNDTERLDFLERNNLVLAPHEEYWTGETTIWWTVRNLSGTRAYGHPLPTVREAIDQAMKIDDARPLKRKSEASTGWRGPAQQS